MRIGLLLDEVEFAIMQEARKGAPWAVMFLLEYKARDRGYGVPRGRGEQQPNQEVRVRVEYAEGPVHRLAQVHALPPSTATEVVEVVEAEESRRSDSQ